MTGFNVDVIADSIAPCGKRLTTITATYPRFIHSEVMTHRDRARNAASSRAIPWPRMMAAIQESPVIPIRWGSEQRGMQTGGEIEQKEEASAIWLEARDNMLYAAQQLADLGVHKSIVNRLTEPFMWITVVMTATEWANFIRLRCHEHAEIHFQRIAGMIRDALAASNPVSVPAGGIHAPFVQPDELDVLDSETIAKVSTARCARVSYLTHDGERNVIKDLELFGRLCEGSGFGHWSPHEHVAFAAQHLMRSGPFVGWQQYRKTFPNECAIEPEVLPATLPESSKVGA